MRRAVTGTLPMIAMLLTLTRCGFDSPVLNSFTELGPDYVQHAAPFELYGQAFGLPGGQVEFVAPTGVSLPQFTVTSDGQGVFHASFPGTTEYRNLVVQVTDGTSRLFGLALRVPRNQNVWERFGPYHLGGMSRIKWADGVPLMANLDDRTTAMTLVLLRKANTQGIALGAVSPDSMQEALATLVQRFTTGTSGASEVLDMVRRLLARSGEIRGVPALFTFPDASGEFLSPEFLAEANVDYSGDGQTDISTAAFGAALDLAAAGIQLSGCKSEDRITVVFQARLGDGLKDSNCSPVNAFKFAKNEEGKNLFLTGGMFSADPAAATPACSGQKEDGCLTAAEWAESNQALGNWVPNRIAMRDDGQGADSVAGDGIWTVAFELPYIPPYGPDGRRRGVRLGYKYTFGFAGSNWGGTEEWPGNNRILELDDVNGDGLVVRYDLFGDESSNKNVANVNQKLCGGNRNPWAEEAKPGCWEDTRENRIDTNDDCVADTYPAPGAVTPTCASGTELAVGFVDQAFIRSAEAPAISSIQPGEGVDGGGFLVEVKGSKLRPGLDCEINTADSGTVSGNRFGPLFVPDPGRLYFLAPQFLPEKANITLLFTKEDGSTGNVKAPLMYNVASRTGCSLVWPESMPVAGGKSGAVMQPAGPYLARLEGLDPVYDASLRVEVGISSPCCNDGDVCMQPYAPCYDVSDPRYQPGWDFYPMEWDAECLAPEASGLEACGSTLQFVGLVIPNAGPARYRVAVRYSMDYGLSWDYCDVPQESQTWANDDGFTLKNAAGLWVDG